MRALFKGDLGMLFLLPFFLDVVTSYIFQHVKRGDLLEVKVMAHKDLTTIIRVMTYLSNPPRKYNDIEIIGHLRQEDTEPHPDCLENGKWAIKTLLCVEVLTAIESEEYLLVGTLGITTGSGLRFPLGKYTKEHVPRVIELMSSGKVATYSQALARLKTFNNPRSIKHMCSKLGIDLFKYSSLTDTL
ncbi:hypothetical protein SK128_024359, partial [Halocaridina rubra]